MQRIKTYRDVANRIGGTDGKLIHELIDAYIDLLETEDEFLNSAQVADMIGIHPNNMQHKRKTKFFPEPDDHVGKRKSPVWRKSRIEYYLKHIDEWRIQDKNNI
ncbi:hypothetical protein SAMN05216312_102196 [Cohnella sp. OV330]|uniref:hypothetical protein n=1 Tax=Cohnella sp. OV330 TaxID=1855288 RepID=UPI0008F012FB|nr:hypothetical protein [Cohnella sp. OV330]SFA91236.1 hypothetical protein SAMN05216312_102196 [Cohnella sp. OV330]